MQPVFSPDGDRIAFRSERDGGGLFIMGRTGESVRRVTDSGFNPDWSPKGDEIVFATERVYDDPFNRGPKSALWIVNAATGQKRRLIEGDAVQPRWSPHGYRVAYFTARGGRRQRDIATINAAGGEPVLVTDDPAVDWNPVWAPDGRYIYFSSARGGSVNLWRVAIDELSGRTLGPLEPVTAPSRLVAHLSFSADGSRLAYASIDLTQNIQRIAFDPVTETIQGEPVAVTTGSKLWATFDLSPDGQWLALTSDKPQEDVYVARADGTGLRQLTNDLAFDRNTQWSPDGTRIAFYSNRADGWDIWTINPDGSALTQLTKNGSAHRPIWSPDGSRMVFSEFVDVNRVTVFDPRKAWGDQTPEVFSSEIGRASWVANSWSPDGKWLAGQSRTGGLVLFSLAAHTQVKQTDNCVYPIWLPDSRRLLCTDVQARTLMLVDTTSNEARSLWTAPSDYLSAQSVSRDGRQIYIRRMSWESDIWLATLK
jgi:Tol biopolymer transport system component